MATKVAKYGVHVIIPIYASRFERVEALNNTNLFSDLWILRLMQRTCVQLHNNSYGGFDKMDFYERYIYTRRVLFQMYNKLKERIAWFWIVKPCDARATHVIENIRCLIFPWMRPRDCWYTASHVTRPREAYVLLLWYSSDRYNLQTDC